MKVVAPLENEPSIYCVIFHYYLGIIRKLVTSSLDHKLF